jgi:surface polysaccharide O-acyltransferase-like enzyme
MHSAQLAHFGTNKDSNFIATNILQSVCIPAVYIFFMNSGATLLNYRKRQSTRQFAKRRIQRVLVPFLTWTVIYYLFDIKYGAFPGPTRHLHPGIRDFILAFVNNDINNLFWFFYAILALYLVTPIFSTLIDDHKRLLSWIVVGYFIFNDALYYLQGITHLNLNTKYVIQPLISSSFLGYFILGYLISVNYLSKKMENWLIVIGGVTLLLSLLNILLNEKVTFFNNIGPFLYSVSLYLLIKRGVGHIKNGKMLNIFAKLSGASLGIYILHPLFYALFDKIVYKAEVTEWQHYLVVLNNPVHIYLLPVVAYIVLSIIILLLKRIELVRYILP